MKRCFHSLRIFTATYTIKMVLQMLGIFIGAYVIVTILGMVAAGLDSIAPDSSFAEGFLAGFLPGVSAFLPAVGVMLLNVIYTYNFPINPGYKYFHSIKDSEIHYKNAIIAANIVSVSVGALSVLVTYLLGLFTETTLSPLLAADICLLATGLVNFSSLAKTTFVRMMLIMPMCLVVGFLMGFTSAAENSLDITIMIIVCIVSVVVFIAGLVCAMATCKKRWRADK